MSIANIFFYSIRKVEIQKIIIKFSGRREALNINYFLAENCLSKVEVRDGASFFSQVLFGSFLERQKGTKEKVYYFYAL